MTYWGHYWLKRCIYKEGFHLLWNLQGNPLDMLAYPFLLWAHSVYLWLNSSNVASSTGWSGQLVKGFEDTVLLNVIPVWNLKPTSRELKEQALTPLCKSPHSILSFLHQFLLNYIYWDNLLNIIFQLTP